MFSEDYILRMINQAVAFLLKIAGLKKAGDYAEAQQAIDQALELLLGLRADIIKRLDDVSILKALTQQGKLDIHRLALIADLFKEDGDTSVDLTEEIEGLVQNLDIQNLPDNTLWTLFCYYERIGAYPKAEDAILRLAGRPNLYANIQPELVAFYERLLERPLGELAEAGMSRGEVKGKLEKAKQNNSRK
jgi:hypothetical protein